MCGHDPLGLEMAKASRAIIFRNYESYDCTDENIWAGLSVQSIFIKWKMRL